MTVMATEQPRDQTVEDLCSLARTARRCQYVVARFADDEPTEWDRRHADIDALLDELVGR